MSNNNMDEKKWYKVDNLAIVYTSTQDKKSENIFRLAAIMKEPIEPALLQQALEITMQRFPYFAVRVRRGLFWNYLEQNKRPLPKIEHDVFEPTRPIDKAMNNNFLFRVLYYEKRISLEIFHGLCDGYGATFLLQTLLANYLRLKGHYIPTGFGVLDMDEPIDPQEYEDAYIRYGKLGKQASEKKLTSNGKVYRNKGTHIPQSRRVDVTTGILPVDKCLELARSKNVTLTEYMTALLMYNLYKKQKNERSIFDRKMKEYKIRAAVPVNCRPYFKTKTLRNFFLVINPTIHPDISDYTFDEVLKDVKTAMAYYINPKMFLSEIAGGIKIETNILARPVPLFLKKRVVSAFYKFLGEKHNSIKFSNVGNFKTPKEMEQHIERIETIMGRPLSETLQCGLISFKNNLAITFNSIIREKDIEKDFFTHFVKKGIPVQIESNAD